MAVQSKSRKYTMVAVIGGGLLAGGSFATIKAFAGPKQGVIPDGIHIGGMDWSNKTVATARAELQGWVQAKRSDLLPLAATLPSGRKKSWSPTRADLGAVVDVDATVREAETARGDDSSWTQVVSLFGKPRPVEVTPKWSLQGDTVKKYLVKKVAPEVSREPKDARFLATKDSFKVVPEEPGVKLDLEKSASLIQQALEKQETEPVALPLVTAQAHVASADLKEIEGEVGRYETDYGESGNRRRNIENACRRINGTVLKPGDTFSYNKTVGPRESTNGFRLAPVIIRGKLEPGLGGGVCQTSSTLYNAVLMSGLKVVRRSHHAFPVHYLPAGRDATVAYGSIDFQFQNDTSSPVAIAADGSGGRVLMRIFGKKVPGRQIRIERTNVSSWDPPVETVTDSGMPAGRRSTVDSGHAGHRVKVWRIVKLDGKIAKRELISSDHYDAFPRVIAVGSGAPRSPKKTASPAPTKSDTGSSVQAIGVTPNR